MPPPDRESRAQGGRALARRVAELLEQPLSEAGFDLEDVEVEAAGRRSVVRVLVDRDGGVDLDAVADATRIASGALDAADPLPGSWVLEVSSPGVGRPLTLPRHWRRAHGRLVSLTLTSGESLRGRVVAAGDAGAAVDPEGGGAPRTVSYDDVRRAVVQVEFREA